MFCSSEDDFPWLDLEGQGRSHRGSCMMEEIHKPEAVTWRSEERMLLGVGIAVCTSTWREECVHYENSKSD